MTEHIEPALTAEEWAHFRQPTTDFVAWAFTEDLGALEVSLIAEHEFLDDEEPNAQPEHVPQHVVIGGSDVHVRHMPAIVAVVNHALPTGHPLKITREDVAMLHEEAEWAGRLYPPGVGHPLTTLAAKLAALLPPE